MPRWAAYVVKRGGAQRGKLASEVARPAGRPLRWDGGSAAATEAANVTRVALILSRAMASRAWRENGWRKNTTGGA